MTPAEFQVQVGRLSETFGKNAYGSERIALIWKEVSLLSNETFIRIVDRFVGELRQAPLLPDFREAASKEREQLWGQKKQEERVTAKEFESAFSRDDTSMIASAIIKRITADLTDAEWESVLRMLDNLSKTGPRAKCTRCQDTGALFARRKGDVCGDHAFRCDCPAGERNRSASARWNFSMLKNFEVCS